MKNEALAAALDSLEEALCTRYHVPSLDGVGPLGAAMALARRGNLTAITAAMEGREMYRWREAADTALAAAHAAAGETTSTAAGEEGADAIPPPPSSPAAATASSEDDAARPRRRSRTS